MTKPEAVNWLINIMADIGKAEHRDLWHYEQALSEIREILELPSSQPEIIRCKDCKNWKPKFEAETEKLGTCSFHNANYVTFKGYCYWAERRTDEQV